MSAGPDSREYVELGEIVGVWGVKGWVKVRSHTRDRDEILGYKTWYLGHERREYEVVDGRRQGAGIVACLGGVNDRDAASGYIGRKIYIPVTELPALGQGEYYWAELEGLEVVNLDNERLGVLDHLFETGANDVMVIAGEAGEVLAPFVAGVVREVDLENGVIRLDWDAES